MSDLGLLTMLAVRLRSRGTAAVIAETVVELHAGEGGGLSAHVDRILAAAVDDGRVRRRGEEGRHSLTPAGEAELNALLAADLVGPDRADAVTAFEAFLSINRRFLASVVGWQDGLVELETFLELIDEVVPINGDKALECARDLATREGIFAGISGGATFAGMARTCIGANASSYWAEALRPSGECRGGSVQKRNESILRESPR